MKRKITLLITGCILSVAALACIQGYFIHNTYSLYVKEADHAIRQQLLELETTGKLSELNEVWMKNTADFLGEYYRGKSTKAEYKKRVLETSKELSKEMSKFIIREHFFEDYDVSYNNYISTIVATDNYVNDTVFAEKILLYGNNTDNAKEIPASQSNWHGATPIISPDDTSHKFEVITRRTYSIANWQKQIALKMTGMLIFTFALLAFVVLLFYLSIKNLISQKKIADIKTDFINNITHEFQTPIAAMDIAVKTLQHKEHELTPEQFGNSLSIIGRQNIRMQKLFKQVTDASLMDGEIRTAYAEPLGCADINEIVYDFKLSHQGVVIECPAESGSTIFMDRHHLTTVLLNLLDNAAKYGGKNIKIKLKSEEKTTLLSVSDDGIGIPQKEKTVIFDKFYRIEKGNIHTTKGLGLGLYYVSQIAKAYNGTVSVASTEGRGSMFTLSFPQP
ncbi:HAMP domain-containing histidine kinase [Flavobacterium zepuense]|uniref:histidine kinase n=1 Tax=Flavobacterium zepuense TaxID=2593302 RepID=A0A552V478_9FLAO|nr:HAMP domain-containing sensor histidine kinase [Flavobacterium zepuense]TRW25252.1 HAMP domain-containing histidine kinase [Flavobacterium zepuense]